MVGYQVTGDELWERTYRAFLDESTWNNITKGDMFIEESAHVTTKPKTSSWLK